MKRFRLRLAALGAAALGMVTTGLVAAPAQAVPDQPLVANTTSMWQTNSRVLALEVNNGVLYAAGDFTAIRPPGAAAGTNQQARRYLAAFNTQTGAPLPFAHDFNGPVKGLSVSPDGRTLYATGNFTSVDGQARGRGAAFDTTTGELKSFNPRLGYNANAVDSTATAVYFGGAFGSAAGQSRGNLAAFTPDGTLLPWAPAADGYIRAVRVSPAGDRVIVGGGFNKLNGVAMRALGSVEPGGIGANAPFPDGLIPTIPGAPTTGGCCYTETSSITDDGQYMYATGEGTGGGIMDGTIKFDPADGRLLWQDLCLGAAQWAQPVNGVVYKASHSHDCSRNVGGFAEGQAPTGGYHLLAFDAADGRMLHWTPNTNGGTSPGLGPRVMATDGTQLFVGGEFTSVNNVTQQGLTRFGTGPRTTGPKRPEAPTVAADSTGKVTVRWPAVSDNDDAELTYNVYRNVASGTPVGTVTAVSSPWSLPRLKFVDTGVATGQAVKYYVRATDGTNLSPFSPVSNTVVAGQAPTSMPAAVAADGPDAYYRFEDAPGSGTAADSAGADDPGTLLGSVELGQPGVLSDGSKAALFSGDDVLVRSGPDAAPTEYSAEAWIKTQTTRGGKVIGFGNAASGHSSNYDRHVYMTDSGQLVFGVWVGYAETLRSSKRYNDGQWHHVVATQDTNGMRLYVDGQQVGANAQTAAQGYSGYWRVGDDNLGGWPYGPSSYSFAGSIDEVAVYPYALDADQVALHNTLSGNVIAPPPPPPSDCPEGQFLATYWNTMDQSGDPVLVRCESSISYDWGGGSPAPEVNADGFSVRWTGAIGFDAGTYRFTTVSDDGIRVSLDGGVILENWTDHGPTTDVADVSVTAGTHTVTVEFYENGGGALASLAIDRL